MEDAVVLDITEAAEAVKQEVDTSPGGAHHLREFILADVRNDGTRLTSFAEICHQQQSARQALFCRVEKLVGEIVLGSGSPGEQVCNKAVRECMLFADDPQHLGTRYAQQRTLALGASCGGPLHDWTRHGLFSDEVASADQTDKRLFPGSRNHGEFDCAFDDEIDSV